MAKQRDQRQPDGKLEAQDEESADRRRDDGPSVGCELTAGEQVDGDQEDNRGGGEESPCAADLPAYRRGHTEEPLGPAFPAGHPGQDSGNESAEGQAVKQGRAQEPEVARPRAQPRRLRQEHEIGRPDRGPGQSQQERSEGSSHDCVPYNWPCRDIVTLWPIRPPASGLLLSRGRDRFAAGQTCRLVSDVSTRVGWACSPCR